MNKNEVYEIKKNEYFRPGEDVYIHTSLNDTKYDSVYHKHEFIEIVYVISGKATHVVNQCKYDVKAGDLVIVNCGDAHTFIVDEESEDKFLTYDLLFTTDFFNVSMLMGNNFEALASSYLFYSLFPEDVYMKNDLNLIRFSSSEFLDILNKIYLEFNQQQKGYINIIRSSIIELITKIFRCIDSHPNKPITNTQKCLVDNAIEYLTTNYRAHINIDELAGNLFLSKNYFRQLFKNITGQSVTNFIQSTRVKEACSLLVTTDMSINEIMTSCGFNDSKFFYKTFKKYVGMTPSEYRKNS